MKNTLTIDFDKELIVMDRTYAKNVKDTFSEEYSHLQKVRSEYPRYTVITREIKRNPNKKTYPNLTYRWMENYILSHGDDEEVKEALSEYRKLREIAEIHGAKGYPVIKKWFLNRYEEIREFGMPN